MTVGDRIKYLRKELELSQEELAKKAGYADKTAISKLEHSGNDISMKQLKRVAYALSTSVENLMGWSISDTISKNIEYVLKDSESHEMPIEPLEKNNNDLYFEYIKKLHALPLEKRQAIYEQIDFQTMRNKE